MAVADPPASRPSPITSRSSRHLAPGLSIGARNRASALGKFFVRHGWPQQTGKPRQDELDRRPDDYGHCLWREVPRLEQLLDARIDPQRIVESRGPSSPRFDPAEFAWTLEWSKRSHAPPLR